MKILNSFLKRKKASLCILAGLCAVSLFIIINSDEKKNENTGGSYAVKIKHYGIDAKEIERNITIPLEDALFSIQGIQTIQSLSENSVSSVFISFKNGTKGQYEAVRDAAYKVYESLPSSAQRPQIISSTNSRIPVWSAAVINSNSGDDAENLFTPDLAAQLLEKTVKPRFESLEGAGEVLVSGAGLKEIFITLDQEKINFLGLNPQEIASVLGMNDSIFSGGTAVQGSREIIITVDGRYDKLDSVLIPINGNNQARNSKDDNNESDAGFGRYIELGEIASITEQEREPDIFSRLNGRKTVSIAVMGRHGADLRKLSQDIKNVLSELSLPLDFIVLSDLGAEESAAFRSVLNAALLGAIMVAIIGFLLNRKNKLNFSGLFCAVMIPLICLISASILSGFGFSLDRLLLAGIAAGIGTAIDAVILCSEKLRKCENYNSAFKSLSMLTGPLIAGGATTVAVLIPLSSVDDSSARIISISIAVVTITALVLSLTILPPLLLWDLDSSKKNNVIRKNALFKQTNTSVWAACIRKIISCAVKIKSMNRRLLNVMCRLLAVIIKLCAKYPIAVITTGLAITVTAVLMLFAKGVDTSSYCSEDSVYAQVEFDGGLLAQEVDRILTNYSEKLLEIQGIKNVETGARTGSGTLLISFNPKQTNTRNVRETAKQIYIPGGFIFFHEDTAEDRYWEIFIYGDEDQKCRELARELTFVCAGHPLIKDRILNFKDGGGKLVLIPNREILANVKIPFSSAASSVRLGVYGPVAYKKMEADREIDVRIRIGENVTRQSRESVLNLLTASGSRGSISPLHIKTLVKTKEEIEPSSIKRDNRRRSASITISTKPADARRVKKELSGLFKKIDLPPGYSIEFDPQAIRQSENISAAALSFILAIIFCYMIIACINESFTVPLLVLSAVPTSLALPAICLILSGSAYNSAVACAFIVVSGMTVNAAILCVDGFRIRMKKGKKKSQFLIYSALREKMPALLSTTGTTVAGALPFIFLTEGANTLIKTLSLTGALGVACSFLCSITVIPSLISIFNISTTVFYQNKKFRLSGI